MLPSSSYPGGRTKASPKKSYNTNATKLDAVLPAVSQTMGLPQKTAEFAILALWPVVLSRMGLENILQRSKAYKLTVQGGKTTLRIRVSDAACAGDCTFIIDTVREALNQFFPQTGDQGG